jgi:hypothetical protein
VERRVVRVAVEHRLGDGACGLEQVRVASEVGEAQQRRPALARAEVLARAAQHEILVRDAETVRVLEDDAQARARGLRQRVLVEQDARALGRPAPDAAAQLVELRQPEALGVLITTSDASECRR